MDYFENLSKLDLDDVESVKNVRDEILDFIESATCILQVLNNKIDENKKNELSVYTDKQSDYE